MPMIHGVEKCFYEDCSAWTQNVQNAQFDKQRVTVKKFFAEKQRWAVELYEPKFQGKQILMKEDNLRFDFFAVQTPSTLPHCLRCKGTSGKDEGLFTTSAIEAGELVMTEEPIMIVANADDVGFESRWNLYFGIENEKGPNAPVLKAFAELSNGGLVESLMVDAKTMLNRVLSVSMNEQQMKQFEASAQGKAFRAEEERRIAQVLAVWQANSHAYPLKGAGSARVGAAVSALFRFTSKMNHSCEPNVMATVDPREGIVSVRTLQSVSPGDELVCSYLGDKEEFMSLPLEERREKVKDARGFHCLCTRCVREEAEAKNKGA
eukprot:TRINITY_DN20887_c0_g1_i1.p1 TRINITY_DN20887_c0_g1~~TRINITY_DN20887_c0_g1_i1.p1  ORF type:complete len:343 (+),score=71.69 TRINITY_DN20887_c0_g1_i1:71-1030(+)